MVTYFISSSANGLYTAASKIPNFVILFSQIFIDAWQLSAVDEYDQEGGAHFFTKVFRAYSGGVFAVASVLIFMCQIITRILWQRIIMNLGNLYLFLLLLQLIRVSLTSLPPYIWQRKRALCHLLPL